MLILISLIAEFNLSAFIIELSWPMISLYGVWRYYQKQHTHSQARAEIKKG